LAFDGLPRRLFSPILTSLAAGGGLQQFYLTAIPTTCLHINFLKNAGQWQIPSNHFNLSTGNVTD
jgi:hypothetical protein